MATRTFEVTQARTELWYVWCEIALEAEAEASQARLEALDAVRLGQSPASAIERETKGTMVAIIAVAAFLEALRNNLREVSSGPRKGGSVSKRIAMIVDHVAEAGPGDLEGRIEKLFDARNETVHSRATWAPLAMHPIGREMTEVAYRFRREQARDATQVMPDVLGAVVNPKPDADARMRAWAAHWKGFPEERESRRGPMSPANPI